MGFQGGHGHIEVRGEVFIDFCWSTKAFLGHLQVMNRVNLMDIHRRKDSFSHDIPPVVPYGVQLWVDLEQFRREPERFGGPIFGFLLLSKCDLVLDRCSWAVDGRVCTNARENIRGKRKVGFELGFLFELARLNGFFRLARSWDSVRLFASQIQLRLVARCVADHSVAAEAKEESRGQA